MYLLLYFCAVLGLASGTLNLYPAGSQSQKFVNDSFIVTCQGSGAENITWKGPTGQRINSMKGRVHVEERRSGEDQSSVLVFEQISRDDKGNYTCHGMVNGASAKNSFKLIVIKPISFEGTPLESNAIEFQNALVRCEVSGDPLPQVVWNFQGASVEGKRYKVLPSGLYINNVTRDDAGLYKCKAFQIDPHFTATQDTEVTLHIAYKPMWKDNNKSERDTAYGYPGGLTNLTCEVVAYPMANFTWRRFKDALATSQGVTVINEPNRSVLQFASLSPSNYGEYECTAANSAGSIKKKIELQKGMKPEKPSYAAVSRAGAFDAEFEIQNQAKADIILGYRIQFTQVNEDGKYSWDLPDYQDVSINNRQIFKIIDLKENTDYVARVASRNAAGLSDYSEEMTFRTLDAASSGFRASLYTSLLLISFFISTY